ncbi:HutD/Ves family protein [Sedimentitalea todarodis]|uniref:HutD family protein n=1 Tax=Sedimentitalea todarodis TaxID=1631240 RepID=A0ABU3VDT7_9RHOB|nr:HutD family protein [Sedimentitalea todarodis]MDU9004338.1 HutD family protein [Sedimentitalea todarodis]
MDILRCDALVDIPWKNGGGITRNIAMATCGAHTAWRLSRADVARDGAFSCFAGLERILTVVSDTGMVLDHPDGEFDADPWQPVRFAGEMEVFARLKGGPLTDLNLMFDPSVCDGSVTTLYGPLDHTMIRPEAGATALHVLAGRPKLGTQSLYSGDTAFVDTSVPLSLGKGDAALEITICYLDRGKTVEFSIAGGSDPF